MQLDSVQTSKFVQLMRPLYEDSIKIVDQFMTAGQQEIDLLAS